MRFAKKQKNKNKISFKPSTEEHIRDTANSLNHSRTIEEREREERDERDYMEPKCPPLDRMYAHGPLLCPTICFDLSRVHTLTPSCQQRNNST